MAFVSMIDNIGFTLADFGFLHSHLEDAAKMVSTHRYYENNLQNERKYFNCPTTVVNLCILLPLLGICGRTTKIQTSGEMFCRTLTLSVTDNDLKYDDLRHWGVYVFDGSRIHGRPLYVEESCDFSTTLLYPNLCGFLAYCGRTQRWSFVVGTEEAKDDFRNDCHKPKWFPKQSEPFNPVIETHYMISEDTASFNILDTSSWIKIQSLEDKNIQVKSPPVESFELSCKDCDRSNEDCYGQTCDLTTRRCNCGLESFGMMCQEPVYPCEEMSFNGDLNLGDFSYVKDDAFETSGDEDKIVSFTNPTYKLWRIEDRVIIFNERPVYYNYQRYFRDTFVNMLSVKGSSSSLNNYQHHLEPLVTKDPEEVLVLLYFSGKQWNFVSPLSLIGAAHNMEHIEQYERSTANPEEIVRHMFYFFYKEVQMESNFFMQLHEWKITSTGPTSPIPSDVPLEKQYKLLSDFSPTWYQLDTSRLGSNFDSCPYLSCSGCIHEYSDMCRCPAKFCEQTSGNCVRLTSFYPGCSTSKPYFIMDGKCNNEYSLNTKECGFDGGDCDSFNEKYPNCGVLEAFFIDDGVCDGKEYNVEDCGWDGGDCEWFNANFITEYPNCTADLPWLVHNGRCDDFPTINSLKCGYDGGDCLHSKYPNCTGINPENIGNGECDEPLDRKECGWDGGDCIVIHTSPGCRVYDAKTYVGNAICNYQYNTEECDWDGGDCVEKNQKMREKYPECDVEFLNWLGNGLCNGNSDKGGYNTEVCGYDSGDCLEHNENYPGCDVTNPWQVGNGECDSLHNIEECGWDGGDCVAINMKEKYPECSVKNPEWLGDGLCNGNSYQGGYNTEVCGYDGGDCLEHNEKYPDCDVEYPWKVGNYECDSGLYNKEECGWDGGDCSIEEAVVDIPPVVSSPSSAGGVEMNCVQVLFSVHILFFLSLG